MSYKSISVAMESDEPTFLEAFINAITSNSENRIVCTNTANLALSSENATKATFTLMIDNWYILRFERPSNGSSSANYFNVYKANNSSPLLSLYFSNNASTCYRYINTFRTWNFKLAINNQIVMLNLHPLIELPNTNARQYASFIFVDKDDYYGASCVIGNNAINTVTNAINGQFVFTNRSTNLTFRSYCYDRLRYVYDAQDSQAIEIVKSKSFRFPDPIINGVAIPRSITLNSIFDCSYCIPDTVLTVDNRKYYVLSNHSLMQIDGPTAELLTQGNITSLDRNLQQITADNSIVQTRLQTDTSNMEIVQNPISDS